MNTKFTEMVRWLSGIARTLILLGIILFAVGCLDDDYIASESSSERGEHVSECGNHVIEDTEVCDGINLVGESCQTLEYHSGQLKCNPDCGDYDVSECVASPIPFEQAKCREGEGFCLAELTPGIWTTTAPQCEIDKLLMSGFVVDDKFDSPCYMGDFEQDWFNVPHVCLTDGKTDYCYFQASEDHWILARPVCELPEITAGPLWGDWPSECSANDQEIDPTGFRQVGCDGVFCFATFSNGWTTNIRPSCLQQDESFIDTVSCDL